MSAEHYIKSTANYLTMWWRAIKSNADNVGTDVFPFCALSIIFQNIPNPLFSRLKIASVRCWSPRQITCEAPSPGSHIEKQHVNMWHTDPYSADGDIQYTWREAGLSPHGSPYICSPRCFAVTVGIAAEHIQNCWGQTFTDTKKKKKRKTGILDQHLGHFQIILFYWQWNTMKWSTCIWFNL